MTLVRPKVIGKFADCMKQNKKMASAALFFAKVRQKSRHNKNDTVHLYSKTIIEEYFENQGILLFEFYQ